MGYPADAEVTFAAQREACSFRNREEPIDERKYVKTQTAVYYAWG
jgi:hypothetical protein